MSKGGGQARLERKGLKVLYTTLLNIFHALHIPRKPQRPHELREDAFFTNLTKFRTKRT